jgi:hypothetical protein
MKLFNALLICFALAGTYTAMAQTGNIDNPECSKRYEKLKELQLKKLSSGNSIKYHKMMKEFTAKMNIRATGDKVTDVSEDLLGWVKNNIDKTKFRSYEEAEKDFAALSAAGEASRLDGKEYFAYLKECRQHCGNDIMTKVLTEVLQEHPELLETYN